MQCISHVWERNEKRDLTGFGGKRLSCTCTSVRLSRWTFSEVHNQQSSINSQQSTRVLVRAKLTSLPSAGPPFALQVVGSVITVSLFKIACKYSLYIVHQ